MTGEGRRSSRSLRIIALALALLVTAPEALAQQAQALPERRIGFLSRGGPSTQSEHLLDAFRNRLRELGHVEGQNLLVEWRWVGADSQRLTEAAADLVRAKVDVILARGTPETRAAKKATGKIPVVSRTALQVGREVWESPYELSFSMAQLYSVPSKLVG